MTIDLINFVLQWHVTLAHLTKTTDSETSVLKFDAGKLNTYCFVQIFNNLCRQFANQTREGGKRSNCSGHTEISNSFSVTISSLTQQQYKLSKLMKCQITSAFRVLILLCVLHILEAYLDMYCNKACLEWLIVDPNNRKSSTLRGPYGFIDLLQCFQLVSQLIE